MTRLEPESSGNADNSRETSKTQYQELPENTASGQANRDSKSLDAAAQLKAIILAWDLITEDGYPTLAGLKLFDTQIDFARKAVA
jgi:hypothetical protein